MAQVASVAATAPIGARCLTVVSQVSSATMNGSG